jgi:hypothetical protein
MTQDPEREPGNKLRFRKPVRINREIPVDLETHFADDLIVQHRAEFFTLTFSEILYPILLGDDDEETQRNLESVEAVTAKPVARIVVTPRMMRKIIEAMTENLEEYERTMVVLKELERRGNEDD